MVTPPITVLEKAELGAGVGVFTADTPLDVAYSQADALLYQAKSAGRNRVSTGRKPAEA